MLCFRLRPPMVATGMSCMPCHWTGPWRAWTGTGPEPGPTDDVACSCPAAAPGMVRGGSPLIGAIGLGSGTRPASAGRVPAYRLAMAISTIVVLPGCRPASRRAFSRRRPVVPRISSARGAPPDPHRRRGQVPEPSTAVPGQASRSAMWCATRTTASRYGPIIRESLSSGPLTAMLPNRWPDKNTGAATAAMSGTRSPLLIE